MRTQGLLVRKPLTDIRADSEQHRLKRSLGPVQLVMLGIGCIVGAGIYVMTGSAAANYAGPAVILSFLIAGFACANHQTGLVWAVFVDSEQEGRGHGRALLDETLKQLKAAGHAQAWLTTGAGTRAEHVYRRHGWREMGRSLDGQIVFIRTL